MTRQRRFVDCWSPIGLRATVGDLEHRSEVGESNNSDDEWGTRLLMMRSEEQSWWVRQLGGADGARWRAKSEREGSDSGHLRQADGMQNGQR